MEHDGSDAERDTPNRRLLNRGGALELAVVALAFALPGPAREPLPLWTAARHLDNLLGLLPQTALLFYLMGSGRGFGDYFELGPRMRDLRGAVVAALCCVAAAFGVGALAGFLTPGAPATATVGVVDVPVPAFVALAAASALAVGLREEALYRVYFVRSLARLGMPMPLAALASTAMFAAGHAYQGPVGIASAFALGGILSAFFLRSGSLWLVALAHALYDFVAILQNVRF